MTTETIYFDKNKNVSLTSYLLDSSKEMKTFNKRPAVLICPGGAYKFCSDREAEPVAMAFLAEGYNAFILRYSLNEDSVFPNPLRDAEKALSLIRDNSENFSIYKDKIAVVGFSAGGHLAASLGTMGRVKPNAMVLGYPCILSSIGKILANPIPSLEKEVNSATPPCFIFSTANDNTVPVENSLAFASELNKNGVPFELHIFAQGRHGISLAKAVTSNGSKELEDDCIEQWFSMCIKWLNRLFKIK